MIKIHRHIYVFLLLFTYQYAITIDYTTGGQEIFLKQLPGHYTVDNIAFCADVSVNQAECCYLTGLKKSCVVDAKALANACFYLKQAHRWCTIRVTIDYIDSQRISLTFFLTAHWLVSRVHVRGMLFGKHNVRQRYLLAAGCIFDERQHEQLLLSVQNWFKKRGYKTATVTACVLRDSHKKKVDITIYVNRGTRFLIDQVIVRAQGKNKWLAHFCATLTQQVTARLKHAHYDARAIKRVRCFIQRQLIAHHLPFATVTVTEQERSGYLTKHRAHHSWITLIITLDCTGRSQVAITGNQHVSYDQLIDYMIPNDHVLSYFSLPLFLDGIKRYYRAHGYTHVSIVVNERDDGWSIHVDEGGAKRQKRAVRTVVQQTPNKQVLPLFGKTVVMGNMRTRLVRMISFCSQHEGAAFDVGKLHETFNRLNRLDIFEAIRLFPLAETDCYEQRPLALIVEEKDPFEMRMRLGLIGTNNFALSTYSAGVSLIGRNVTHAADTLTINAEITRFCRDVAVCYRYPYMGGLAYDAQLQFFDKKTDVTCLNVPQCLFYTATQQGGDVQVSDSFDRWRVLIGAEALRITHLCAAVARALCFDPAWCNARYPYGYVEPVFYFTAVDNAINPRSGSITDVRMRGMVALSMRSASYVRCLLDQAFFMPISAPLVLAVHVRAGALVGAALQYIMPSERFYLGGACNVRAYQQDMMPPLACWQQQKQSCLGPVGSRFMAEATIEMRIDSGLPVLFTLFQDVGALYDERSSHWCIGGATGGGVRYLTPVGPLRFDIGVRNGRWGGDGYPCAWFLTIGHAF
jgi:outer membrane protein assembly factor BamA